MRPVTSSHATSERRAVARTAPRSASRWPRHPGATTTRRRSPGSRPSGSAIVPRRRTRRALDDGEVLLAIRGPRARLAASPRARPASAPRPPGPRCPCRAASDMPGRAPARSRSRHSTRVQQRPRRVLVGGVHDHAGRLVDRQQVLVLVQDVEVSSSGSGGVRRTAPSGTVTTTTVPSASVCDARRAGWPSSSTNPASIHCCACVRDSFRSRPTRRTSAWSRRSRASPDRL